MDREVWHAAIHGVAKSRTRLSNWTEHLIRGFQMLSDLINIIALAWLILFSQSVDEEAEDQKVKGLSPGLRVSNIPPPTPPSSGKMGWVAVWERERWRQSHRDWFFHMVHCCQCCRNNQANEFSPGDSARCSCFSSLSWNWIKCDHKADFPWKYKVYIIFHFITKNSLKNNFSSKPFTLKCQLWSWETEVHLFLAMWHPEHPAPRVVRAILCLTDKADSSLGKVSKAKARSAGMEIPNFSWAITSLYVTRAVYTGHISNRGIKGSSNPECICVCKTCLNVCRSNEGRKVGQEEKQKRWGRKKDAHSRGGKGDKRDKSKVSI